MTKSIRREAFILFDDTVTLESGAEWHSTPIRLEKGDDLALTASSAVRFYAGIFDEPTYRSLQAQSSGAFPFGFGSDQVAADFTWRASHSGDYFVVLRIGVFTR